VHTLAAAVVMHAACMMGKGLSTAQQHDAAGGADIEFVLHACIRRAEHSTAAGLYTHWLQDCHANSAGLSMARACSAVSPAAHPLCSTPTRCSAGCVCCVFGSWVIFAGGGICDHILILHPLSLCPCTGQGQPAILCCI
jgi:hypothetical protein